MHPLSECMELGISGIQPELIYLWTWNSTPGKTGFIQASLSKIQGLFKDSSRTSKGYPTVLKDLKFRKNPKLSAKILLQNARLREWRH